MASFKKGSFQMEIGVVVYCWLSKLHGFGTLVDIRDVWKSMIAV